MLLHAHVIVGFNAGCNAGYPNHKGQSKVATGSDTAQVLGPRSIRHPRFSGIPVIPRGHDEFPHLAEESFMDRRRDKSPVFRDSQSREFGILINLCSIIK